jgi:hypothetical protein
MKLKFYSFELALGRGYFDAFLVENTHITLGVQECLIPCILFLLQISFSN